MDYRDEELAVELALDDQGLQTKYREVIEKMILARSEQEKIK